MFRIHKSPAAENDLDEIWWYIAQDNPGNADKLLDEIEETCWKLARFTLPVFFELGFSKENIITSLEMRMKCGIGKCGRCNVGEKKERKRAEPGTPAPGEDNINDRRGRH